MEIDLGAPGFVEIIGVTENRFVLIAGMNGAGDEFVVLRVVTGFDVGLRIDIEMRRPVHESNRKQIRFFRQQSELGPEDPVIRLESAKDGELGPVRQAHLEPAARKDSRCVRFALGN